MTDQNCMSPSFCISPDCFCPGSSAVRGRDFKVILTDGLDEPDDILTQQAEDLQTRIEDRAAAFEAEKNSSDPVNKFGCSYLDCDCTSPCWEKNIPLPGLVINGGSFVVNGGVTVIINKASE